VVFTGEDPISNPVDPLQVWENEGGALGPSAQPGSLFRWHTLREIADHPLRYPSRTVAGKTYEVELTTAETIQVWRADDREQYFCHGLTFGGKASPRGTISPYGNQVPTILHGHYELISEGEAVTGDILVWRGADARDVIHSAILTAPIKAPGKNYLDYESNLRTKNGIDPETTMTLERLIANWYGESYNVYRRK